MQPEARLRARCRMFCQSHVPLPTYWTAIEHGRQHKGTKEERSDEWRRLKAQGVQTGIADMLFFAPSYVLAVELKAGSRKPSDAQLAFQARMAALGHGWEVVRSVESLGERLIDHGIPVAPGWRLKAQLHDMELDTQKLVKKRTPAKPRTTKPTRGQVAAGNAASLFMVRGK